MSWLSSLFKKPTATTHTPVEAANTLQSKSILRIIDLISEGEIVGLVDGSKSIYFDDTALENADGSFNFEGVEVVSRTGTLTQTVLNGFPKIEAETAVGTNVDFGTPVVRTLSTVTATSARVTIAFDGLSLQDVTTGDLNAYSVQVQVEVKPDGGSYIEVVNDVVTGKTTSTYERAYRFNLPGAGPWDIRVTRISPAPSSVQVRNEFSWASYTTITDHQLSYPYSAIIGVAIDAQQFGSAVPTRTYDIYGLKISIPDNYNPTTRAYTGTWTGTFQTAWSDNPAWVFYDLVTQNRYGLGQFVSAESVDKFGLYAIAQYCDELVPDGEGGYEPRFTFNEVIASADDAMRVLITLAGMFRGMVYWGPSGVGIAADKPTTPTKIITPANVIDGNINYSGTSLKARHTFAFISWKNKDNNFEQDIEPVDGDPDEIARWGWRPAERVAFGTTSRGQAHRCGRWLLDTEQNEHETASWSASFDQADLLPGDVVLIADPAYSGVDFGGRITAVDPGGINVTVDRPITIEAGKTYTLYIMLSDDVEAQRTLNNSAGVATVLTFFGGLDPLPVVGAIWALASSDVSPRPFRIIARVENEKNIFAFTALFHDTTKYARVEQNITLVAPSFSVIPSGGVAPPTDLVAVECPSLIAGGVIKSKVILSWVAAADPRVIGYQIQTKAPGENWQPAATTASLTYDLFDLTAGNWGFRVRSLDSLSQVSTVWATIESQILGGLLEPSDGVTSVRAVFIDRVGFLDWDEIDDLRPVRYELRKGNNWEAALFVGDVSHPPWATVGDDTYWIGAYIGGDTSAKTYSETPSGITITESIVNTNVLASYDEQATLWTGTFTGGAGTDSTDIRTGAGGDVAALADIFAVPDLLDLGGQQSGTYTIPVAHRIAIGRVAACQVIIDYAGVGVAVGDDITDDDDITLNLDIIGNALSRYVDIYPEIRTSQNGGSSWSPWQRFSSGVYSGSNFDARMQLITEDEGVIAYCTKFVFTVDVPDRVDHITNQALVATPATAFLFRPDGAASDAAFNGGPNSAVTPNIQISIHDAVDGDIPVISSKTLAGFSLQIQNASVGVARTVDIQIRGY